LDLPVGWIDHMHVGVVHTLLERYHSSFAFFGRRNALLLQIHAFDTNRVAFAINLLYNPLLTGTLSGNNSNLHRSNHTHNQLYQRATPIPRTGGCSVVFDSAIDRTLSPRKIFHLEMTSSVGLRSREVIETHAFAHNNKHNNKERKQKSGKYQRGVG
jgi:hypothetical protein